MNLSTILKYNQLNYWRKPKYNIPQQSMAYLIETEDKINIDKFQSCLNSIIEKHPFTYTNGQDKQFVVGDLVKYKYISLNLVESHGRSCAVTGYQVTLNLPRGDYQFLLRNSCGRTIFVDSFKSLIIIIINYTHTIRSNGKTH